MNKIILDLIGAVGDATDSKTGKVSVILLEINFQMVLEEHELFPKQPDPES